MSPAAENNMPNVFAAAEIFPQAMNSIDTVNNISANMDIIPIIQKQA